MTPEALRLYAADLPPETLIHVPAGLVMEILGGLRLEPKETPLRLDLTPEQAGTALDRSAITIRAWCAAGLFPGAYKQRGRAWKIPVAAIEAFQVAEQRNHLKRAS